jgi:hypothetical protein
MQDYTISIKSVLGRMYNWKMSSAYAQAKTIPEFPEAALAILKQLSEEFGNCGWCEGSGFDKLRDANNEVALRLGYVWDDNQDRWVPQGESVASKVVTI